MLLKSSTKAPINSRQLRRQCSALRSGRQLTDVSQSLGLPEPTSQRHVLDTEADPTPEGYEFDA